MRPAVSFLLLASLFASEPAYRQAVPDYRYQFPRDHFDHPEFRTEWWYYTGNLRTHSGARYGFELVFFRLAQHRGASENPSSWRADDLYLAHLALTDIDGQRYRFHKRLNRAGPGIAGVSFEQGRIWNGNWESKWDLTSGTQTLSAVADEIHLHLRLTSQKPPVIHGENGVSQKGDDAGQASYYVSLSRLAVEGVVNGMPVTGTAWMDHEWFSNQLAPNQTGWDWFSVQLDNGSELMLFDLRHLDGAADSHTAGTYIDRDGRATHLSHAQFDLEPLEFWTSPHDGARYPIRWRITIPTLKLTLECSAAVPDQEFRSEDDIGPSYWEGAVSYSGSFSGAGYLEMTGYTKPMRL
ncbi:MAG TPA: lipocalin-like domain-containing protein [Bryobacteraceae bacterium]|nr:lipocalin-like domain-containing protein [Bryobacteraceae bacterium]